MTFFDALILGVVEGVTEFLPISSTAHLVLSANILGLEQTDFLKSFEIIIQLGAIFAVVTLYFKSFFDWQVIKRVLAGFIPTAVMGAVFYKTVKNYLGDVTVIAWALLIGGVVLIIFEMWHKSRANSESTTSLSLPQCVIIGFFQVLAFIPGVSRAGATIVGGLTMGVSRSAITEFSFLLAVPTMLAATGYDAIKNKELIFASGNLWLLVVGFAVSYLIALLAIRFFLAYVRNHNFTAFGVYRVVAALLVLMLLV